MPERFVSQDQKRKKENLLCKERFNVALFRFDCVIIKYPFLASRTKSYSSSVFFTS